MNGATTLDALRELPRDIETERSALATISLNGSTVAKIRGALTPEHFFESRPRILCSAMLALSDRGQPIDHITVTDVLRSRGELEPVGGSAGVAELLTVEASPGNCVAYTQVVREHALSRTVIERALDVCDQAFASRPLEEIAQRLRAAIPEAHQSAEARGVAQRRLAEVFDEPDPLAAEWV